MPTLTRLQTDLTALEQDHSLLADQHFAARVQALDTLDFLAQAAQALHPPRPALLQRVRARQQQLQQANRAFYRGLRQSIRQGSLPPAALHKLLTANCRYRPGADNCLHWGPEAADQLVAGLFHSDRLPQLWTGTDPEMVHYESTPASALLELVDRVPLGAQDRFVDIGAGLGQVPLLLHLLTGVAAVGLEVLPAYVAHARQQAARLGIRRVSFRQGDARTASLCAGTVYFLFTPFRGRMLETVLARLRQEAAQRPLTVCSFGPCTHSLAAQTDWLAIAAPEMNHEFRLAIFHTNC